MLNGVRKADAKLVRTIRVSMERRLFLLGNVSYLYLFDNNVNRAYSTMDRIRHYFCRRSHMQNFSVDFSSLSPPLHVLGAECEYVLCCIYAFNGNP